MMNKGTLVVSPIRPITQGLGIPTVLSDEVKGGFHSVTDSVSRDAIPVGRRQMGMLVYLTSTDTWFQLRNVIDSDLSNNSNWALVQLEDTSISEWQDSVLSFQSDPTGLTPSPGDRYVVEPPGVGQWNLRDNQIAVYDPSATPVPWNFISPVENMTLRRTDDDNSSYYFDGIGWVLEQTGGQGLAVFHDVEVGQQVFVGTGSHYLVYGDLVNAGEIVNYGKVITLNGNYVGLSGSVFDILGTGSYQGVTLLSELETGPGLTVSMSAIDRRQIDLDINFGSGLTYSYLGNTLLLDTVGGGLTGPQGDVGQTGPLGANSLVYRRDATIGQGGWASNSGLFANSTTFFINDTSYLGYSGTLGVTANANSWLGGISIGDTLQVSLIDNSQNFGIYTVDNTTQVGSFYSFDVTLITGTGIVTIGPNDYASINYVKRGPQGLTGPQGNVGNTGATGPQGLTGPQGGGETIQSNEQVGPTYSLQLTDGAKMVLMNSSSANAVVVSNLSWPLGSQVLIVQKGTGQTTIVPDVGVTLFSESNKNKIASQYSSVSIIQDSNNPGQWYMFGNLTL